MRPPSKPKTTPSLSPKLPTPATKWWPIFKILTLKNYLNSLTNTSRYLPMRTTAKRNTKRSRENWITRMPLGRNSSFLPGSQVWRKSKWSTWAKTSQNLKVSSSLKSPTGTINPNLLKRPSLEPHLMRLRKDGQLRAEVGSAGPPWRRVVRPDKVHKLYEGIYEIRIKLTVKTVWFIYC